MTDATKLTEVLPPWIEAPWRVELVRLIDRALPVVDTFLADLHKPEPNAEMLTRTRLVLNQLRKKAIACHLPPPDGQTTLGLARGATDWIEDLNSSLLAAVGAIERHYLTIPPDDVRFPPLPDFTPVILAADGSANPPIPDGQALLTVRASTVVDVSIWRRNGAGCWRETPINDIGVANDAQERLSSHAPLQIDSGEVICPPDIATLMVWPEDQIPPRVMSGIDPRSRERFLTRWNALYPETPPINYLFKRLLPTRWARIHSLPGAKRYPQTTDEWRELECRQNAVIDHLVSHMTNVRIVINVIEIDNYLFKAFDLENIGVFVDEEGEAVFQSFMFETTWESHTLNPLLAMIAGDQMRAFIIAPDCLIAPYDGGMDIILKDPHTCWEFKRQFKSWLSSRADGL
jgi:hypothetical protein